MSWRSTLIKFAGLVALAVPWGAQAQNIESAVMPGPVIQGHAELEGKCDNCHVRFDRAAQVKLCLDCHKPVRADVAAGSGYHGRIKPAGRECRTCHSDHRGRGAKIVAVDEKAFDHGKTDFPLRGKHKAAKCSTCHRPGVKHREAPSDCVSCHRKDDKHKDGLGPKCGNCHDENTWKEGRFDHGKTKFPLRRAHAAPKLKCESCHENQKYENTSRECVSCHREDDMKKGHKGQFGPRCEKCHDEGEWKSPVFNHDRDTHYPLVDRHRQVKCDSCHKTGLFREKTPIQCVACHRKDDAHKASLGDKCDKCHSARGWKSTRFDHDMDTQFPLADKHKTAKCEACHKDKGEKGAKDMSVKLSKTCISCHEREDREKGHRGRFGDNCSPCHDAKGFKPSRFSHERDTDFVLAGKHVKVACASCHKTVLYKTKTPTDCYACHKDQDVHFETYGLDCAKCHTDDDWRRIKADAPLPPDARPTSAPARGALR